ncbi:MAG: NFACT RNA binding domain-containing protein [Tissierellia bacterium]|nr:NFACT RNA binding domain-containing protein [Tissierellia bacterium]
MSYDGIVTRSILTQLLKEIKGGKIQKITQPSKNDIILNIYSRSKSFKLLLSANNSEARVHFTNRKFENPITPPNFCMVLRKHLNQGKILNIEQNKLDRVLIFTISSIDELGFNGEKKLIVEIMGKYSNIILTDENYKIIDSIKRISDNISSVRQVLPGFKYFFPKDDKFNILDENFKEDILYLDQKLKDSQNPKKLFYEFYTGLSPTFAKEICYISDIDTDLNWKLISEDEKNRLNKNFHFFIEKIKKNDFSPTLLRSEEKYKEFYAFNLKSTTYKNIKLDSMSEAIDMFFSFNQVHDRLRQIKNDLIKKINNSIKATKKKISILNDNIKKEDRITKNRKKGDLLSANVYNVKKGDKEVEVSDFYNDNKKIKITLDPKKDVWGNIDAYYKKSKKIKKSIEFAKNDLPKQLLEIKYLEQVSDFIERAYSIDELDDIREELEDNKIIKRKNQKRNKIRNKKSKPIHYRTVNNSDIYIGKNSKQNDYLTLKMANKDDYFLHVRNLAGSHVILKPNGNLKEEDIISAAFLAAKHSSVKNDKIIDVDYTLKKNVNKPKGAKLGMVYYENFKTISIDMDYDHEKNLQLISK